MATLVVPNVFVNATTIQAAPFNANFNAVAVSVNSVDNTQIGAAGIFASQLIPTTGAQATFGGSSLYTFPAGLSITGALTTTGAAQIGTTFQAASGNFLVTAGGAVAATAASGTTGSYVPPVYTAAGGAVASTIHTVFVTATTSASAADAGPFTGGTYYTATVTLSGSAAFTSATSFTAGMGAQTNSLEFGAGWWIAAIGLATTSYNMLVGWNGGGTIYIAVDVGSGYHSTPVSFYLTGS